MAPVAEALAGLGACDGSGEAWIDKLYSAVFEVVRTSKAPGQRAFRDATAQVSIFLDDPEIVQRLGTHDLTRLRRLSVDMARQLNEADEDAANADAAREREARTAVLTVRILDALRGSAPLRTAQLADALETDLSQVSRALRSLLSQGAVVEVPKPEGEDRRIRWYAVND